MTEVKESSDTNQDEKLNLDRILVDEIGEGKYQVQAFLLFAAISFFFGLTTNDFIFIADRVKTRCRIPECDVYEHTNFSPPWLSNAVPKFGDSFDNCHRFAPYSWNITADSCPIALFNKNETLQCTEYVYQHQNSAVYEFGLACDEWRWFLFGCLPLVGMTISLPLTGFISDRWGRRFALSMTAFNLAWINLTRYWAGTYTLFIVIAFLGSVFGSACMDCCVVAALELVSPSRRMVAISILISFNSLGAVTKGLIAWTQPYWRNLILILYTPMLMGVFYFWIGPESIRWLISKNRLEETKNLLLKAAKKNGRVLSDATVKKLTEGADLPKTKGSSGANFICLVWEHKTILFRCLIISIWSLSSAFMVKGLAISSVTISGNKYVNFCTVSAISIPGYWAATLLNDKIGRRRFLCALFLMGGICQLGYIFISKGPTGLQLALYLLTKFCTSAVQNTLAVYKAELFPTSHRSRLNGFTSTFARIGGFGALLIPALAERVWDHLPNTIFSILAFLSGALTLLTPETLGSSLPITMEDAARLGKDELSTIRELPGRILCWKRRQVGGVDSGKLT